MKFCRTLGVLAAIVTVKVRALARKPLCSHPPVQLLLRIAADQKRIWMSPVAAVRGDGWKPALAVIGTTVALVALDPVSAPWIRRTTFRNRPVVRLLNRILSGRNMALAINALPISLYGGGLIRGNSYAGATGWLAGEAAANAEIVAIVLKNLGLRMRPTEVDQSGDLIRTWFRRNHLRTGGAGGFPSGHTAAAFAVASVIAERYRRRRWVPCLAYGFAGVVGGSRLLLRAHFPSDVFAGAVLGHTIGRRVVLTRSLETARDPTARQSLALLPKPLTPHDVQPAR